MGGDDADGRAEEEHRDAGRGLDAHGKQALRTGDAEKT
jgi:hypothetical protein